MVIEHSFVTTLEAPQALALAAEFLAGRGFVNAEGSAFAVQPVAVAPGQPMPVVPLSSGPATPAGGWNSLEMKRGVKNPARAKSVAELPQVIRLEFDRGRINVAASIPAWARSFWTAGSRELKATHPKVKGNVDLMMAIIWGLEQVVVHQHPPHVAASNWLQVESHLIAEGQKKRRRSTVWLVLAIIFVVVAVTLVIVAAMS